MIQLCSQRNDCRNYIRGKEPCWTEQTKGKAIWCSAFELKKSKKVIS